jgi:alpha-maltose-1-phosphate synthase
MTQRSPGHTHSAASASQAGTPRVALVRGPNLNPWEAQMFAPLRDRFDIVGIASSRPNFELAGIPFPVKQLFSFGQAVRSRWLRSLMDRVQGDHHDLQGLREALAGVDIVHAAESYYYFTAQAARLKPKLGFRLVVTAWENIPFQLDHPATRQIKKAVFEQADRFLAVTSRARDVLVLEGAPADRIHVLMPGLDVEHFAPAPRDEALLRRFDCGPDDLVILYIAHLSRQKGVYDLCAAVRTLLTSTPDMPVRLLIAGRGPEEAGVRTQIRRLGLEGHARLIGPHSYEEMPRIHNLADVFVLASQPTPVWQEQFGYVLAESMACGKAVVATTSGSIPEVVGDAGVLVPPSDFQSLAEALGRLLADSAGRRELGARARMRAATLFDQRAVSAHIRAHYEALLSHARA